MQSAFGQILDVVEGILLEEADHSGRSVVVVLEAREDHRASALACHHPEIVSPVALGRTALEVAALDLAGIWDHSVVDLEVAVHTHSEDQDPACRTHHLSCRALEDHALSLAEVCQQAGKVAAHTAHPVH